MTSVRPANYRVLKMNSLLPNLQVFDFRKDVVDGTSEKTSLH